MGTTTPQIPEQKTMATAFRFSTMKNLVIKGAAAGGGLGFVVGAVIGGPIGMGLVGAVIGASSVAGGIAGVEAVKKVIG